MIDRNTTYSSNSGGVSIRSRILYGNVLLCTTTLLCRPIIRVRRFRRNTRFHDLVSYNPTSSFRRLLCCNNRYGLRSTNVCVCVCSSIRVSVVLRQRGALRESAPTFRNSTIGKRRRVCDGGVVERSTRNLKVQKTKNATATKKETTRRKRKRKSLTSLQQHSRQRVTNRDRDCEDTHGNCTVDTDSSSDADKANKAVPPSP